MTQQSVCGAECNMGRRVHSAALRARGSRPSRPLVWTTPHFHASRNKSGEGMVGGKGGGREGEIKKTSAERAPKSLNTNRKILYKLFSTPTESRSQMKLK